MSAAAADATRAPAVAMDEKRMMAVVTGVTVVHRKEFAASIDADGGPF